MDRFKSTDDKDKKTRAAASDDQDKDGIPDENDDRDDDYDTDDAGDDGDDVDKAVDTEDADGVTVLREAELLKAIDDSIQAAVEAAVTNLLPAVLKKAVAPLQKSVDTLATSQNKWYGHFDECHEEVCEKADSVVKAAGDLSKAVDLVTAHEQDQVDLAKAVPAKQDTTPKDKVAKEEVIAKGNDPEAGKVSAADVKKVTDRGVEVQSALVNAGKSAKIEGLSKAVDDGVKCTPEQLAALSKAIDEAEALVKGL